MNWDILQAYDPLMPDALAFAVAFVGFFAAASALLCIAGISYLAYEALRHWHNPSPLPQSEFMGFGRSLTGTVAPAAHPALAALAAAPARRIHLPRLSFRRQPAAS